MMRQQRRITKAYFDMARHQYTPLIHKLAYRVGVHSTQVEELKIRALEELLKCMICYNRSGSFMTFFHGRLFDIFRHIRDAEFRAKRIPTKPSDSMTHVAGPCHDMDSPIMVRECLECLDESEKQVIVKLFFNEKTVRQISGDLSIVPSTVCRIKTRAIRKMQRKCKLELNYGK